MQKGSKAIPFLWTKTYRCAIVFQLFCKELIFIKQNVGHSHIFLVLFCRVTCTFEKNISVSFQIYGKNMSVLYPYNMPLKKHYTKENPSYNHSYQRISSNPLKVFLLKVLSEQQQLLSEAVRVCYKLLNNLLELISYY